MNKVISYLKKNKSNNNNKLANDVIINDSRIKEQTVWKSIKNISISFLISILYMGRYTYVHTSTHIFDKCLIIEYNVVYVKFDIK